MADEHKKIPSDDSEYKMTLRRLFPDAYNPLIRIIIKDKIKRECNDGRRE